HNHISPSFAPSLGTDSSWDRVPLSFLRTAVIMDSDLERCNWNLTNGQCGAWNGSQLGIDALHLSERAFQRGSNGPDWTALPEGVLLNISRFLNPHTVSNARAVCSPWRGAFSLKVHTARLEISEHRAAQARAFIRAFIRAFPSTTEIVLDITFRRTAREKIQAALEEHFLALQDFGFQALQLNLDLNSFNERKIKLLDVSLLAAWNGLVRLTLQESGWRSQQLRVDAATVFSSLPALQELSVVCKYSGQAKAKWWRPPTHAERLAARMPTWPPAAAAAPAAAAVVAAGLTDSTAAAVVAAAAVAKGRGAGGVTSRGDLLRPGLGPDGLGRATGMVLLPGQLNVVDEVMEDAAGPVRLQLPPPLPPSQRAGIGTGMSVCPVVTQHLRCQMTQNQSMSAELQKTLKRITPTLQSHVSALTFEIVEETYAEPSRCATPLELSALPGLKSLTVLSGAEDALSHSKLDLVGATGLETLVLFDVSCGCWCYKKPGHGIPPRLLSAPPAYLRSLTVVGFVVNQCQNLHALSSLTCLEELRLEQPDPDCLAAVGGELLLTWLPTSLRKLKLHSVVLPPCGVPMVALTDVQTGSAGISLQPAHHALYVGGSVAAASGLATAMAMAPSALAPTASFASHPQLSLGAGMPAWLGGGGNGTAAVAGGGAAAQFLYGVAPVAPLPQLRELYLSKCKVPTLGMLGVCSQLTALGVINCLSCSGMLPVTAAMPALRFLAVIYTLAPEQEHGGGGGALSNMAPAAFTTADPVPAAMTACSGFNGYTSAPGGFTAAAAAAGITVTAGALGCNGAGCSTGSADLAGAAATVMAPAAASALPLHVSGLPLPPVVWGSDEQVAAVAACSSVTSMELILPRGSAGANAVAALASMPALMELDVSLPCGLSECILGLARLSRSSGGRLRRLTLWVDGRTCVNRTKAQQLQAIQRSLQAHMPDTLVEWAGAESRQGSWTGLEARVFNPH
ncbi:hypothetical protein VaNZ11_010960, partial [Volvox africanus]